jgi:PAS domain S-box-containing protein
MTGDGLSDGADDVGSGRYRYLIEHIQDAVVEFEFVDGDPIVRDANRAFAEVFGYDVDALRGESLNEWIVPEWEGEEAQTFDARTAAGEVNYQRVKRETADGLREFLYRGIPYEGDGRCGFAVYTDLTDIARQERRLEVLNRVLRHNLRNDATLILGHTTRLLDELGDPSEESITAAAAIEKAADELESLTQEAGDIQRVLSATDGAVDPVDCVPILRRIAGDYRRRAPAADIETDLPDSLTVRASSDLAAAVDSLVDNAVVHNPADAPWVRIRAAEDDADGWATITVDDDGPPIPAAEREVVTGEASITPTRHGTGLGLWLAKWTVEAFGGELSFGSSDRGGNSVRLRLPQP